MVAILLKDFYLPKLGKLLYNPLVNAITNDTILFKIIVHYKYFIKAEQI